MKQNKQLIMACIKAATIAVRDDAAKMKEPGFSMEQTIEMGESFNERSESAVCKALFDFPHQDVCNVASSFLARQVTEQAIKLVVMAMLAGQDPIEKLNEAVARIDRGGIPDID